MLDFPSQLKEVQVGAAEISDKINERGVDPTTADWLGLATALKKILDDLDPIANMHSDSGKFAEALFKDIFPDEPYFTRQPGGAKVYMLKMQIWLPLWSVGMGIWEYQVNACAGKIAIHLAAMTEAYLKQNHKPVVRRGLTLYQGGKR